jgi:heme oxygenase
MPTSLARATLMATLRDATAASHARAEATVPVLDAALTLAGYASVLARFRDAYATLEDALADVGEWPDGFDVGARRKLPLLERDLAWLRERGVATPPPRPLATSVAGVARARIAAAIGALYVLEGATLGGQVILRRIGARLGVAPGAGASFYAGYGAETGTMWKAFAAMANAWGEAHRDAWDEVVESARATFDAITQAFDASEA